MDKKVENTPVARLALTPPGRLRVRPHWLLDGLPKEMYRAGGDLGMVLVRTYESLCFDGKWGSEKLNADRVAQARMRLFRRIGIQQPVGRLAPAYL